MADDLDNRGSRDRTRINVNEAHEVRYWTERFSVSEQDLRRAVAAVGVSVDHVAVELGRK